MMPRGEGGRKPGRVEGASCVGAGARGRGAGGGALPAGGDLCWVVALLSPKLAARWRRARGPAAWLLASGAALAVRASVPLGSRPVDERWPAVLVMKADRPRVEDPDAGGLRDAQRVVGTVIVRARLDGAAPSVLGVVTTRTDALDATLAFDEALSAETEAALGAALAEGAARRWGRRGLREAALTWAGSDRQWRWTQRRVAWRELAGRAWTGLAIAGLAWGLVLAARPGPEARRASRIGRAMCPRCGYSLRPLREGRCYRCGELISWEERLLVERAPRG